GKNKIFNTNNLNDLEIVRNLLSSDSGDDEDIVLDESDADEEEDTSKREDDSESERVQQAIQKMKIRTIDLQIPKYSTLMETETS
ncbi:hypothetical protein NPIL_418251, partial [Nephila pilipes]